MVKFGDSKLAAQMEFEHFIITQFNLRNFLLSDNEATENWVEWTKNRIGLFREYCLPSVISQTCSSFRWLLFFDKNTPADLRSIINELETYSFINVCFSDGMQDFFSNYSMEVKNRISPGTGWIITTRIDNDDCLHRDAVKIIQENFRKKDKYLISLASGYILNLKDRTLSHYFYPASPFLSLVESTGSEISAVFKKGHTAWDELRLYVLKEIWLEYLCRDARKSRFILKNPMWIQIVHGNNVSNDFYRGLPVTEEKDLSVFSVRFFSNPQKPIVIGKYFNYVYWKRYVRGLLTRIIINK